MTLIEQMAEAYWNAFRDGYIRVGGDPKEYPKWAASRDPVKAETLRCLRHAVEVLRTIPEDAAEAGQVVNIEEEVGRYEFLSRYEIQQTWTAIFAHLFPEPLEQRRLKPIPNDADFVRQQVLGALDGP